MRIWHKNNDIDSIINDIKVKDDSNRLSITVYEYKDFVLSLGKDDSDIQEMGFTKDEMKEIYNFLKQYYE